jgi:ribulose-bisphosphate carboxylase large chain
MDHHAVTAVYRLAAGGAQADARARALALEQSIEMPSEAVIDPRVLDAVMARVDCVSADGAACIARLSLSAESIGGDPGQLMNMLFGNCSLQADVDLIDVEVPASLAQVFGGPNHGIAGLRAMTGAVGRPLSCSALKPIGSTLEHLAALCGAFARAGIDIVKDDHGWADQASAPFAQRVAACQRAIDAAGARDTERTLYAPSLSGTASQMHRQVDLARSHGVCCLLIAPMVCGVATLVELKRTHPDIAFLAHPALAGTRISPPALLGKLFRLFGADAVIFPNHGGRFSFSPTQCHAIAAHNRAPWHGLRAALPVPAGGMAVERVPEIVREYGVDTMLLIGGSLLMASEALESSSRAFVAAVAKKTQ